MATNIRYRVALAATLVTALIAAASNHDGRPSFGTELDSDEIGLVGNAGRVPDSSKPKLTAYFDHESYKPGDRARLTITDTAPNVSVFSSPQRLGAVHGRLTTDLRVGDWPSGVYFARLTSGRRVGYAPFVLGPRHYGEHKVAVVMPTETWQAYNFRDDDGNGSPDTWSAAASG